jgi:hypothetical protein
MHTRRQRVERLRGWIYRQESGERHRRALEEAKSALGEIQNSTVVQLV